MKVIELYRHQQQQEADRAKADVVRFLAQARFRKAAKATADAYLHGREAAAARRRTAALRRR